VGLGGASSGFSMAPQKMGVFEVEEIVRTK
jgi:hypothetical protein